MIGCVGMYILPQLRPCVMRCSNCRLKLPGAFMMVHRRYSLAFTTFALNMLNHATKPVDTWRVVAQILSQVLIQIAVAKLHRQQRCLRQGGYVPTLCGASYRGYLQEVLKHQRETNKILYYIFKF